MCPDRPPDVYVCWAHGLLFIVDAMCSPVYCLSPPIVSVAPPVSPSLVSLFSLLVSVVLCWSVVLRRLCVMWTAPQLSACLPAFPLRGGFCFSLSLFYFVIKALFPCILSPRHASWHKLWDVIKGIFSMLIRGFVLSSCDGKTQNLYFRNGLHFHSGWNNYYTRNYTTVIISGTDCALFKVKCV